MASLEVDVERPSNHQLTFNSHCLSACTCGPYVGSLFRTGRLQDACGFWAGPAQGQHSLTGGICLGQTCIEGFTGLLHQSIGFPLGNCSCPIGVYAIREGCCVSAQLLGFVLGQNTSCWLQPHGLHWPTTAHSRGVLSQSGVTMNLLCSIYPVGVVCAGLLQFVAVARCVLFETALKIHVAMVQSLRQAKITCAVGYTVCPVAWLPNLCALLLCFSNSQESTAEQCHSAPICPEPKLHSMRMNG